MKTETNGSTLIKVPLYRALARHVEHYRRTGNAWDAESNIVYLVSRHMPSGSGIDNGMKLNLEKSTPEKLVFSFSYHHMNEHGYYVGWTEHELIVKSSMAWSFETKITGRDRRGIKEYLYETFDHCLRLMIDPHEYKRGMLEHMGMTGVRPAQHEEESE